MRLFGSRAAVLFLAMMGGLNAASIWRTTRGQQYEGNIAAVVGADVVIVSDHSSALVSVADLDDAELARVAEFQAKQPVAAPLWKDSKSKVAQALSGRLETLTGDRLTKFDPGRRTEPDFYLIYFSAHWCPPCRQFTPNFVKTYARLQQLAPNRFETIFVSDDRDSAEQLEYVRTAGMPWPVLRYRAVGSVDVIERWAGPGIPCLVVLTRDGDVVFHSYHGEEYIGPQAVLEEFESLLTMLTNPAASKRATHRLAVVRYIREHAAGAAPVRPYLIELDTRKYRTLEVKQLTARLDIDDHGLVTNATFEPALPAVLDYQLSDDAGHWLFLPAVKGGRPQPAKVELPLVVQ